MADTALKSGTRNKNRRLSTGRKRTQRHLGVGPLSHREKRRRPRRRSSRHLGHHPRPLRFGPALALCQVHSFSTVSEFNSSVIFSQGATCLHLPTLLPLGYSGWSQAPNIPHGQPRLPACPSSSPCLRRRACRRGPHGVLGLSATITNLTVWHQLKLRGSNHLIKQPGVAEYRLQHDVSHLSPSDLDV